MNPQPPLPPADAGDPLDLRGTPCPLNYVRSRLALEKVPSGSWVTVLLDRGEPEEMVGEGLQGEGHHVIVEPLDAGSVRLRIQRDGVR